MKRKYSYFIFVFPVLSFLLILFFFIGDKPGLEATEEAQVESPRVNPYISASGIVEPASGNIAISSPFNRPIEKIYVSVNTQVKKGDLLVQLYNQDLIAKLKISQINYEESLSNLQKLQALPREEDLLIASATLARDQAVFNLSIVEYCSSLCRGKSRAEKCIRQYKYEQAEAEFLIAQAQFEKVKSGAWCPELKIAQDAAMQAKAGVEAIETELERTYLKSPIDGKVLQLKIHEGEMADPSKTALIVGNIEEFNLRVSIDQFNVSKFQQSARAVAYKRGNTMMEFPLKFLHIEPVMVPKKYLTNELNEKVDTQIFEILYRIEKNDSHLFIGEQMDVYIYLEPNNT